MKRCPTCSRTYTDDALSFCLDDGAVLLTIEDAPSSFDPNATMRYAEARDTSSPTEVYRPGPPSGQGNQVVNPSWSAIPGTGATAAPPRKRSLLPWIIGGGLLVIVLGVGLVVLVVVLVSLNSNSNRSNANNSNNSNSSANKSNRNSPTLTNSNNSNSTNANSSSSSGVALRDDFSSAKWYSGNLAGGYCWYENDEYHMRAAANSYIVIYAPDKDTYFTQHSTVKVTARSVSGTAPNYGYGVVVLGELSKKKELEDYGFLIWTGNDPQYKVVLHRGGTETPIVNWTKTQTIRTGTSPNQLEVRVSDNQMAFYINGQYATSIEDSAGYKNGSVGFYTSDTYEVAFDDLEISR
jgi:hypothetical protein